MGKDTQVIMWYAFNYMNSNKVNEKCLYYICLQCTNMLNPFKSDEVHTQPDHGVKCNIVGKLKKSFQFNIFSSWNTSSLLL